MIISDLTLTRAIKLMKIRSFRKEESWASLSQMSNQSYFKISEDKEKNEKNIR